MRNSFLTRRRYNKDLIVIITLIFLPSLIYLHNLLPLDIKNYDFVFFEFRSNYYESLDVWFWLISSKLVYIITYIVWFSTCQYWWKNVILVPLIYLLTQLFGVLDDELNFVDKNEILVGFLISLPIIFLIYVLKKKWVIIQNQKV